MSSDEITESQLRQLAHDMVVAGNLNMLYGIEPFMNARAKFDIALAKFVAQVPPSPEESEELPVSTSQFSTDAVLDVIPDCLKNLGV
jgi:hypothetical protein